MAQAEFAVTLAEKVADIAPEAWDSCAGDDNPFVSHAFLDALERSGSATARTGWLPRHLVMRDSVGKVVGCAPLYLKSHSYGEYVFDWGWADAYQRAGLAYYPKLQCAVPFTPVPGPRLMSGRPGAAAALAAALPVVARRLEVSSVHVTFARADEAELLEGHGFLRRLGYQYHWTNEGFASFDEFLGTLASRKRKQIRTERRAAAASGLTLSTLVGPEVTPRHWDAFHRMYRRTVDRKWGEAYLRREFFELLSASKLGGRVVLVWAEDDGQPVAGAFNLLGDDTLYGRTWAAARQVPFLHFEACYYRALDFAIAHGLARVEAGAQGAHKLGRGYLPTATWSAHWIAEPHFRHALSRLLGEERRAVEDEMREQAEAGPYRKG